MHRVCVFIVPLLLLATGARGTIWMAVSDTMVEPDEIVTFSVFSDTDEPYGVFLEIGYGEVDPGQGMCRFGEWIGPARVFPEAGANGRGTDLAEYGFPCYFLLEAYSYPEPADVQPGEHFQIDYRGLEFGPGTYVDIMLYDFYAYPLQTIVLDQTIPEPATVLMLGVGGLAIRRRRRR